MEVYVVAHAPSSVQRLEDVAKLVFNFGDPVKGLIVTKPSGVAAQVGLPEVSKLAYRLDKTVLILPDIKDAIELLDPSKVLTISYEFGRKVSELKLEEVNGKILLVVGTSDPGLSKVESELGECIYPSWVAGDVGPVASLALILKMMKPANSSPNSTTL